MAWYIASVPFWFFGVLCVIGLHLDITKNRHREATNQEIRAYTFLVILWAGTWAIAARMVS